MILLIDNYDSFSYNLYQLIGSVDPDIKVIRNDELTVEEIAALNPKLIVLSPGPGKPADAGVCVEVVQKLAGKFPIFGVCLGHQAICEAFGATVTYAKELMHGKTSIINLSRDSRMFRNIPAKIQVARYHSLAADPTTLPPELKVSAATEDGQIMAVEHVKYPVYGMQYHPESVLTEYGKEMMENLLKEEAVMIKEAIIKLTKKEDLSYEMARDVMNELMSGTATDVQKSAYLTALTMKGETIEEITASAEEMRKHATRLEHDMDVLEIVGTGGDGSNSFNISTTSSLVIAAGGVPVAKHGNRAASSKSGAADCLEALGVNIMVSPEKSAEMLKDINICFLFAQSYHKSMRHVGPIRKELGIRTIFNILGPLANPASANMQVMGVFDEALVEPLAHVLSNLGVKRAMVVYGQDKLDEISAAGPTTVCEVNNGEFKSYTISPEQYGYLTCTKEDLVGGTPEENAKITLEVLSGVKGPRRTAVVMNAGAALYVAGKADTLEGGMKLAEDIIDSGKAKAKLDEFVKVSNQ